jgi:hypothetical protein
LKNEVTALAPGVTRLIGVTALETPTALLLVNLLVTSGALKLLVLILPQEEGYS